jgi:hypothetical protein
MGSNGRVLPALAERSPISNLRAGVTSWKRSKGRKLCSGVDAYSASATFANNRSIRPTHRSQTAHLRRIRSCRRQAMKGLQRRTCKPPDLASQP